MKEIAFHIADIAENSLRAEAYRVEIALHLAGSEFCLTVTDDGCGMDEATLRRVTDPFYTTRTTRRAGLGLPFLFQSATQCGGRAEIDSTPGKGTRVRACFRLDHIDCLPAGDMASTLAMLLTGDSGVHIVVSLEHGQKSFSLSSAEVREALGEIPAGHTKAISAVREILADRLAEVFGNALI